MTIHGLWPSDFKVARTENAPEDILHVQAVDLGEKTRHLLEGRVERSSQGEWLTLDFYMTVPSISYSYHLLKVRHKLPPYPVELLVFGINASGSPLRSLHRDRADFETRLKFIFKLPLVRRIVEELLAYAKRTQN